MSGTRLLYTIWSIDEDNQARLRVVVDQVDIDSGRYVLARVTETIASQCDHTDEIKVLEIEVPDAAVSASVDDVNDIPDDAGIVLVAVYDGDGWWAHNAFDMPSINRNVQQILESIDVADEFTDDGEFVMLIPLNVDLDDVEALLRTPRLRILQ